MTGHSVLIVEDELIIALDIQLQLEELGYTVVGIAESGEQGIDMARHHLPDVTLMDIRLRGSMSGIDAAGMLSRELGISVVYLTSHSDADTVRRASLTSPFGYLTKPFQMDALRSAIEAATRKALQ